MTPEKRYLGLKGRLASIAFKLSNGNPSTQDELLSVADLAVARGLSELHRCRIPDIDSWLTLRARNAMLDFLKGEARYRQSIWTQTPEAMERYHWRRRTFDDPDLSEDAAAVAAVLISESHGDLRTALDRARQYLYVAIGWRRTWRGINELKAIYGG